jgi:hypothetical protein
MAERSDGSANIADLFEAQFAATSGDPEFYMAPLHLPLGRVGHAMQVAAADTDVETARWLHAQYGPVRIVPAPAKIILAAIERVFRSQWTVKAVCELTDHEPQFSAATTITRAQAKVFVELILALSICFAAAPHFTGAMLVAALVATLVVTLLFRLILLFAGLGEGWRQQSAADLPDTELPIYSILVPLYREANVMPQLIAALRAIDYPKERLDIKLIVEADDEETAKAADLAAADACFSVVRVPPGTPRTKPRACNYGLSFALGEFTVIFDAEDRPETDQLRKAVAAFRAAPGHVACLQARLDFFNANENWLTKVLSPFTPK